VEDSPTSEGKEVEPRWPAWTALLTAPLLPAATSRRTAHVSLISAFGVHVVAVLLSMLTLLVMAAWVDIAHRGPSIAQIGQRFGRGAGEILDQILKHPREAILLTLFIVLFVETAYFLLGLLVTPWGARNEPLKSSIAHGVRWTWLHTIHLAPAIVLSFAAYFAVELIERDWQERDNRRISPRVPRPAGPIQEDSEEWRKFREDMERVQAQRQIQYATRPWYVRYQDEIAGYLCCAVWSWWFWGLLRGVGAIRGSTHVDQPPLCEACGYNLTGASMEDRCPECGDPVINSLGPDSRPGPMWERRCEVGALKAWWRCSIDSVFRSRWFGRQVRVSTTNTSHRSFLLITFAAIFLIGAAGIVAVAAAEDLRGNRKIEIEWAISAAPFAGFGTVGAALFLTLLSGWNGINYYRRDKRNLLSGGTQTACYGSGILAIGAMISWGNTALMISLEKLIARIAGSINVDEGLVYFFWWTGPFLFWLVLYAFSLHRATATTRYANK
jgi:hypothetical protein